MSFVIGKEPLDAMMTLIVLRQQLMQMESERDFQSALVAEREEGIKQIETTIQEVNDIFIDLATLVNEQSPMIGLFVPFFSVSCSPANPNR